MIIHGRELSSSYLDEMWDAIMNKIPANKWVAITKEPEQAVAAIKHFIDLRCYEEDFDLSLNSDFTMFRKNQFIKPVDLQDAYKKKKLENFKMYDNEE